MIFLAIGFLLAVAGGAVLYISSGQTKWLETLGLSLLLAGGGILLATPAFAPDG